MVGLLFLLALLILVTFDLVWTFGNEMFNATIIVACPLLLVRKLPLHYLVALLLNSLLESLRKESNIINLLILFIIIFIFN
jgi:hypothetical protein